MNELYAAALFDLSHTIASQLLSSVTYPWEALPKISDFILEIGSELNTNEYYSPKKGVWIAKDALIYESASISSPCIIGKGAEIRHCAFIRGSAIIGCGALVGNSCEIKNSILFDEAKLPHFNYAGDSIIGHKAHLGAGVITSNIKSDKSLISVCHIPTNLKKMGAMIGDYVEVGCNTVLNPGTVIGADSIVYPSSSVRGFIKGGHIYKSPDNIIKKERS